ncbi:unnamed protein product, partial [Ranitomeya imitator]
MRGDLCPFDHGSDPVVVEDVNLPGILPFPAQPPVVDGPPPPVLPPPPPLLSPPPPVNLRPPVPLPGALPPSLPPVTGPPPPLPPLQPAGMDVPPNSATSSVPTVVTSVIHHPPPPVAPPSLFSGWGSTLLSEFKVSYRRADGDTEESQKAGSLRQQQKWGSAAVPECNAACPVSAISRRCYLKEEKKTLDYTHPGAVPLLVRSDGRLRSASLQDVLGRAKYACAGAVAEDQKRTSCNADGRRRSGPETPIRPDQQRDRPGSLNAKTDLPLGFSRLMSGQMYPLSRILTRMQIRLPQHMDMVDGLISAIIQMLELKEEEAASQDISVAFKRMKRLSRVFPNHKEFDNTTSRHWEHPGKRFPGRKRLDILYPFAADLVSKWSESPKLFLLAWRLVKGPSRRDCCQSPDHPGHVNPPRLDNQWTKVHLDSDPASRIPVLGIQHHSGSGLPPKGETPLFRVLKRPTPLPLRFGMRVLGKMVTSLEAVPYAQFHSRPLQLALLSVWDRNPLSLDRPVRLLLDGRKEDKVRGVSHAISSSRLAPQGLVCGASEHVIGLTLEAPRPSGSSIAGSPLPPEFSVSEFNVGSRFEPVPEHVKGSGFCLVNSFSKRPCFSPPVAFLVAITSIRRVSELAALSCRSPFLVLHQDKVVLRPVPSFLPKVVSAFHINEDIVLPSLCPSPVHPLEKSLHNLDVVRAIRVYLARTAHFRQSDPLFVVSEGRQKGLPASKSTVARWIRSTILEAYCVQDKQRPPGVRAHSA